MGAKFLLVVGARPNFMKAAPLLKALQKYNHIVEPILLHTGQHYDYTMSKAFFDDLDLPEPDIYLGVGSDTHARQTAKIMMGIEDVLMHQKTDLVIVFGDVNSTLASAVAASKLWIPVAHVEAGLRSFDRTMPEEINRIVTDVLSELLFVTERSGIENLKREGIPDEKIFFVGNVMIDTLKRYIERAKSIDLHKEFGLEPKTYVLLTLHRPSNVDVRERLTEIWDALSQIAREIKIVFPVHPRTRSRLNEFGLKPSEGMILLQPLSYTKFLALEMNARFVMTDSGGVQEETTVLGVPCITLRENTERPITVEVGTNVVVGNRKPQILAAARNALNDNWKKGSIPPLWDGHAAERIAEILVSWASNR